MANCSIHVCTQKHSTEMSEPVTGILSRYVHSLLFVSDIAIFVLKRDVKLQLTQPPALSRMENEYQPRDRGSALWPGRSDHRSE